MKFRSINPVMLGTLILSFIIAILEGFDLQSMGIAAPRMKAELGLNNDQIGFIFSAAVLGTLPGALLAGHCADKFGRKAVLIISIFLFGLMTLGTPFVNSMPTMIIVRFLTGLGIGGALPLVITLVSEAVSKNYKATAVSIMYSGMPLGGVCTSLVALNFDALHEWRLIFYVGGVAPLLLVPFLIWLLPESRDYLALKKRQKAAETQHNFKAIFAKERIAITLCLWISFFGTLLVLTLLQNWLPTLMNNISDSKSLGVFVQLGFNFGGAVGALILGILMDRFNKNRIIKFIYTGMLLALTGLAFASDHTTLVLAAVLSGLFIVGCQSILYSLAAKYYPTHIRGSGVGAAVSVGRLGSFAGPLMAGFLLSAGQSEAFVIASSLPVIICAACAALFLLHKPVPIEESEQPLEDSTGFTQNKLNQ